MKNASERTNIICVILTEYFFPVTVKADSESKALVHVAYENMGIVFAIEAIMYNAFMNRWTDRPRKVVLCCVCPCGKWYFLRCGDDDYAEPAGNILRGMFS